MAVPEFYPPADIKTQWFEDDYPGDRMDVNVACLHTTETPGGWPGYDGGSKAPNLTARPDIPNQRLLWRQHFRINTSSRALKNLEGGVETNTNNIVQVELVGTCDPKNGHAWATASRYVEGRDYLFWPEAPNWALDDLADFLRWCHVEQGVPFNVPKLWLPYPQSYGATSARMSNTAWNNFKGICGHQHVPENVHGDPGDIDIDYLLQKAGEEDMPTAQEIADAVWADPRSNLVTGKPTPAGTMLSYIHKYAEAAGKGVTLLLAKDPADVDEAALAAALAPLLSSVDTATLLAAIQALPADTVAAIKEAL